LVKYYYKYRARYVLNDTVYRLNENTFCDLIKLYYCYNQH